MRLRHQRFGVGLGIGDIGVVFVARGATYHRAIIWVDVAIGTADRWRRQTAMDIALPNRKEITVIDTWGWVTALVTKEA